MKIKNLWNHHLEKLKNISKICCIFCSSMFALQSTTKTKDATGTTHICQIPANLGEMSISRSLDATRMSKKSNQKKYQNGSEYSITVTIHLNPKSYPAALVEVVEKFMPPCRIRLTSKENLWTRFDPVGPHDVHHGFLNLGAHPGDFQINYPTIKEVTLSNSSTYSTSWGPTSLLCPSPCSWMVTSCGVSGSEGKPCC